MSTHTIRFFLLLLPFMGISGQMSASGVTLYTPYTKISVPPGQSIDYSVDVINNAGGVRNVEFSIVGLPEGWEYDLKAGGWKIEQLSVLPNEKKTVSFRVEVPLEIDKGSYQFKLLAKGLGSLPLTVTVSEKGTFRTEFTSKQSNMEGHATSSFNFNTELKNRTGEKQIYSLKAEAPRGWNVIFKPNHQQATSVNSEENATENISIEVRPPSGVAAGSYKIPVHAVNNSTSASLELEVVITGSYSLELTTPKGLLSTEITAGDSEKVELVIKNTGSAELKDIKLSSSTPSNWEVEFEPQKLDRLEAGETAQLFALIKADKKAIPGDYVTNLEARTPEASSKTTFRISVKTSALWGWSGILVILASFGIVYQLFRKYGRR